MCLLCVHPGLGRLLCSCVRHALASSVQGALQEARPLAARAETAVTRGKAWSKPEAGKAGLELHNTGLCVLREGFSGFLFRRQRWKGKGFLGLGT